LSTYPQGVSLGLHHARSAFFTTVHSTVLHRGQSPLFTRPQAVEKLDFEFWILDFEIEHSARKLAVQQIGAWREE